MNADIDWVLVRRYQPLLWPLFWHPTPKAPENERASLIMGLEPASGGGITFDGSDKDHRVAIGELTDGVVRAAPGRVITPLPDSR